MNTRAQWVDGIDDLYGSRLSEAGNYLTVAQVSERTSLSKFTILDLLSRPPITSDTNALAPISRPAARINNSPLYSPEQVERTLELQRRTGHRHLGGGSTPLPSISSDEAAKRDLVSVADIRAMLPNPTHEQTIRRWSRDYQDFPRAVALRSRDGKPGVPIPVRNRSAVLTWLTQHGKMTGDETAHNVC